MIEAPKSTRHTCYAKLWIAQCGRYGCRRRVDVFWLYSGAFVLCKFICVYARAQFWLTQRNAAAAVGNICSKFLLQLGTRAP